MTSNNFRLNALSPPPSLDNAARKFSHLQADLVDMARMWAIDDVSAAMAHQLNEPLTALRLYLHEIKEKSAGTESLPSSMQEILDRALHETERVCEIMEKLGHFVLAPAVSEVVAIARGRTAIDAITRSGTPAGKESTSLPSAHFTHHNLTPREREVLALIVYGASNKVGGQSLAISTRTFEVHRAHIMEKLGAKNAADLVRMALSETVHK